MSRLAETVGTRERGDPGEAALPAHCGCATRQEGRQEGTAGHSSVHCSPTLRLVPLPARSMNLKIQTHSIQGFTKFIAPWGFSKINYNKMFSFGCSNGLLKRWPGLLKRAENLKMLFLLAVIEFFVCFLFIGTMP